MHKNTLPVVLATALLSFVPESPLAAQQFAPLAVERDTVKGSAAASSRIDSLETRLARAATQLTGRAQVETLAALTDSLELANCSAELFPEDPGGKLRAVGLALVNSAARGECLWGGERLRVLDLGNVTANTEGGSIYTDLLTTAFGPVRTSLGTMIAATSGKETDPERERLEAVQRFLAGGGNVVLGAELPVLYGSWLDRRLMAVAGFSGRGAVDVEALGATSSTPNSTGAASGHLRLQTRSNRDDMTAFGFFRAEQVWNAQLPSTGGEADRPSFWYGQLSVGVEVQRLATITWTRYFDYSEVLRLDGRRNQVSITAARQL